MNTPETYFLPLYSKLVSINSPSNKFSYILTNKLGLLCRKPGERFQSLLAKRIPARRTGLDRADDICIADILRRRLKTFKGDYVFPRKGADEESPTYLLNERQRNTPGRIGIRFRLYDCRNTFATRKIEDRIDLLTLAAMLVHSNLNQARRYAHPSEARKRMLRRQKQKEGAKAV